MSSSKLTMIGMYNYDNSLFDSITLPSGINKDVLIPEILRQCDEFEILYPNLDFLKAVIGNWSQKHYRTFEKWVEGLAEEFNPLHNYDRHEIYTDTKGSNEAVTETKEDRSNRSAQDANISSSLSQTSTASSNENDRKVSAYDASTYQPKEKEEGKSSGSGNGVSSNESHTNSLDQSDNTSNGRSDRNLNEVIQHEAHLYGNIGVTTSTQMLEDFLRVERWNIYEHIAELFVDEFCIRVY